MRVKIVTRLRDGCGRWLRFPKKMDKALDLLELRLAELEYQIYGSEITGKQQHDSDDSLVFHYSSDFNLLKMISEIDNKIKALTIGKDKFNHCYNELQRLQKWLRDDDDLESLISTFGSHASVIKFEEVLAFEDEIREDSQNIEQIEKLMPSLDKPYLGQMDQLEPKLIRLKLELIRMQHESSTLDQETRLLIEKFNLWYQEILENLKIFNEKITEMERKKAETKYDI